MVLIRNVKKYIYKKSVQFVLMRKLKTGRREENGKWCHCFVLRETREKCRDRVLSGNSGVGELRVG